MMGYLLGSEDGEKDKPTVKAVGAVAFGYACYLWGQMWGWRGISMVIEKGKLSYFPGLQR